MPKRWLTADTHFFHTNIIKYCNRPFFSVEEMNAMIAANWNSLVAPEDEVYHLGDFALDRDMLEVGRLFRQLPGKKWLIRGNHDKGPILQLPWEGVYDEWLLEDTSTNIQVVLVHNGQEWQHKHKLVGDNTTVFCANVHEIWKMRGNLLNVGTDVWHFLPVEWDRALKYWQYRYAYYQANRRDA